MLMAWTHDGWGGPWFLIFPLLWIGVVVFAFSAFRGGRRRRGDSAEATLGERFARGEITADEYRQRLAVLRGKG